MSPETPSTAFVVPALPNWQLVVPLLDASGKVVNLHRDPVIAWRIDCGAERTISCPVTPDFSATGEPATGYILQRPDGSMFVGGGAEIANNQEAIAYYNQAADAQRADAA